MPKFAWEGKTRTGAVQKGVIEAQDAASVEAQLKRGRTARTSRSRSREGTAVQAALVWRWQY